MLWSLLQGKWWRSWVIVWSIVGWDPADKWWNFLEKKLQNLFSVEMGRVRMRCSSRSSRERLADIVNLFKDGGQVIIMGENVWELVWIRYRYFLYVEWCLGSRPYQKTILIEESDMRSASSCDFLHVFSVTLNCLQANRDSILLSLWYSMWHSNKHVLCYKVSLG